MISTPKPRFVFRPRPQVFHPKLKRLPRSKVMTIGAGFVCPDGVVLAADTKESFQDDSHTYVNKIVVDRHFLSNKLRPKTEAAYLAIAGSGSGPLVSHVINRIKPIFHECATQDISVFRDALVELMPQLYDSPAFRNYPCSDMVELMTQFIVVMRPDSSKASVFEVNSSVVEEIPHGVTIIGHGTMRETADELQAMNLGMWDSTVAALYLISEAKRHYSSVGGVTHIYSIPHYGPQMISPEGEQIFDQGAKEVLFGRLRKWHHELVMLAASIVITDESYKSQMAVFQEDHQRIRDDFMAIEKRDRERIQREQSYRARKFVEALNERQDTPNKTPDI
jgi:hypothetical protein